MNGVCHKLRSCRAGPGRNDPCPCGSGRKFKHCCLGKAEAVDQVCVRLRRAEGHVVDALFPFALHQFGKAFFESAWLDFWLGEPPQNAKEFGDVPEFETMFVPWFVTRFVADPEGEAYEPHWPHVPIGLHWLTTSRPPVDALAREWVTAACASPMSLFVIETVDPGRSVDIRDVLTGWRVHVLEQSASQGLHRGDLYFTRVVTVSGTSLMFGAAPYIFPPRFHLEALDWRDRLFGRRTPTRSDLDACEVEILRCYHVFADRLCHPTPPQLRNTDGDDIAPTTLVYDVSMPVSEVFERLRPLATLGDDEHVSDVVEDATGTMIEAVLQWVKRGNRKMKQWDNTILGTLHLTVWAVTCAWSSRIRLRRADRLAREIARRLGTVAVLKTRSVEDLARRARRDEGTRRARGRTRRPG